MFRQDGSCPALLEDLYSGFPYGAVTRSGPPFQTVLVTLVMATGLVRVRSPLLAESRLMSFPPATEMFQFAGFASAPYGFRCGYRLRGGLPHSEIPGSTIARISPGLIAACHALHRLSVPRHPPNALKRLILANPKPAPPGEPRIRKACSALVSRYSFKATGQIPIRLRPWPKPPSGTRHKPAELKTGFQPIAPLPLHNDKQRSGPSS